MAVSFANDFNPATSLMAIDEPLEYARLYLDGNMQMWVDAEDSLERIVNHK